MASCLYENFPKSCGGAVISALCVIPAEAGVQGYSTDLQSCLRRRPRDSGQRRNDGDATIWLAGGDIDISGVDFVT